MRPVASVFSATKVRLTRCGLLSACAAGLMALLLCTARPAAAQLAAPRFTHVTVAEGLPHGQVRDVLQDRLGFMWFGTAGGGARFDGYELVVYKYDPNDFNSLSNNNVWTLHEDRHGSLWIGTQDGLNRFDPATETFTRFKHDPDDPAGLPHSAVRSIYGDHRGRLWVGTYGSGLSRYDVRRPSGAS